MTGNGNPQIAVFRPDDERATQARELLISLGVEPIIDPMLEIVPTGRRPHGDAAVLIFTSKTGVELATAGEWEPGPTDVWAVGPATAEALQTAGIEVTAMPEEYSSQGLVTALEENVDGMRVDVARSDHGSATLIDGLNAAGARVSETVLYRLERPRNAGHSTELAAAGELAGAVFTSSLTVEHFLEAATERGLRERALEGLTDSVVGAIGQPTADTLLRYDITVDVIASEAVFETLAEETVRRVVTTRRS